MTSDGYIPIETISGAATSYSFTDIPSTYTDLILRGEADTSAATLYSYTIAIIFNGDTSSTYDTCSFRKKDADDPASYFSTETGEATFLNIPGGSFNTACFFECDIYGYSNSARNTFFRSFNGWSGFGQADKGVAAAYGGQWRSTAAVTSITTNNYSGVFGSGTSITLYGRT
tara:strand:- start:1372 stop:1887 length:516 start_codon:yes stop_codon:yes gene_type:complete